MSFSSSPGCLQSYTPERFRRRPLFTTPVVADSEESFQEAPDDEAEVCFLPDLEALRFWSHPRGGVLHNMDRQQGVLWKRRDVFKNRWRPRWFVLSPGQGVLTYYLLTSPLADGVAAPFTQQTPSQARTNTSTVPMTEPARGTAPLRSRTTSWDSLVSENTVDYDVVPRGTIYLLGCTVEANHYLSKPAEHLFALTIRSPDATETEIHLSARTSDARALWIEKIARVCGLSMRDQAPTRTALPNIIETPGAALSQDASPVSDRSDLRDSTTAPGVVPVVPDLNASRSWKSLGEDSSLYADIPEPLVARLQQGLRVNLALCDVRPNGSSRKRLFDDGVGRSAYQSVNREGVMTIQSHCLLRHHAPMQIFNLLIDITRRQDYETNVRCAERLKVLNPHTFLDYYAFNAFWPTAARDFAVLSHWQVVGRGDERAIVVFSFSCSQADDIKPQLVDHVRASLLVSMYLLRAVDDDHCRITRILSFDPAGNITRHLAHIAVSQQANLPATIGHYLACNEPVVDSRLLGPFTNAILVKEVINHLPSETVGTVKRQLTYENMNALIVNDEVNERSPSKKGKLQAHELPTLEVQALYLLVPIVLFRLADFLGIPGAVLWFCLSAFLAVRQVVLMHFGAVVPKSIELDAIGPVTCRFLVDLKGVLRFISNKKEEREELAGGTTEVSVVHIVACAVARALKKEEALRLRRVRFPWLLIDECVEPPSDSVDVSVSENSGGFVTLKGVEERGVQSIADELGDAQHITDVTRELGQCLVLATPDYDQTDMELDVASIHPDVAVVAVVGGVRLVRNTRNIRSSGFGAPADVPRPMLSISLTINAALQNDIVVSRRFAEEVQKMLQFPEMAEDQMS